MGILKRFDRGSCHVKKNQEEKRRDFRSSIEDGRKVERIAKEMPGRTQDIIEIYKVHKNGIFEIQPGIFTKSYYFYSGQYYLLDDHLEFSDCDATIREALNADIQYTFIKRPLIKNQLSERLHVPENANVKMADAINRVIAEKQMESSHGMERIKMITLTSRKKNKKEAEIDLNDKEKLLMEGMKKLNCHVSAMTSEERLQIFRDFYYRKNGRNLNYERENQKGAFHDFRNDIAPLSFQQKPSYLRINQTTYVRVFFAAQYAERFSNNPVHELFEMPAELLMSVNHTEIPKDAVERRIQDIAYYISRRKQKEQQNNNKNQLIYQGLSSQLLQDEKEARIMEEYHRSEKAFFVSCTLCLIAESLEELNRATKHLYSVGDSAGVRFEIHENLQREGLATALPHGVRFTRTMREMTTSMAFLWHPYWSTEVMENGIWYGQNQITANPIIMDRRTLDNPHALVFGSSGASKSGTVKMEILQILHKKMGHVIIFDPTREYKPLVENYDGAYVDVSMKSGIRINPLEIPYEIMEQAGDRAEFKAKKGELFKRILKECMDGADTAAHRSILDTAISAMYDDFFHKRKNKERRQPLLSDLSDYILKVPLMRAQERAGKTEMKTEILEMHEKAAEEVVEAVKTLTSGSINFFSEESNIDIWDRDIVTVGFSDVQGYLYNIAVTIFLDYVETIASRNMRNGIDTYFTIDELHELIKSEIIAGHLTSRWKTARHARLILTGILQDITNIVDNKDCRQLLTNSSTVIIMKQQASNVDIICRECSINSSEVSFATNCPQGTGIIRFGSSVLPFDMRIPVQMQQGVLWEILNTDTVTRKR